MRPLYVRWHQFEAEFGKRIETMKPDRPSGIAKILART
ncbi:MAG: hypothetical protein QOF30_2124 [Acidimicrobiaceae bacterium]|jgi:hypothetical protein|nr:hypothetical protein [Acidimicrobiaceae bacterium]